MIVDRDGNIIIITQENVSVQTLVSNLENAYDTYKNDHLIVNLSSLETIELEDIIEFLRLSNNHRSAKKSFVVVSDKVDLDEMPDEFLELSRTLWDEVGTKYEDARPFAVGGFLFLRFLDFLSDLNDIFRKFRSL